MQLRMNKGFEEAMELIYIVMQVFIPVVPELDRFAIFIFFQVYFRYFHTRLYFLEYHILPEVCRHIQVIQVP